jgi:predicted transcriptional regulator
MSEVSNKNTIIEALKQHPEGLTISSISEITGLHRHTSRKYINELISVGEIIQRSVGVAKLCYLNCAENKAILPKRSFLSRFNIKLVISAVLITFLLSEVTILAYENSPLNETLSNNVSNTSPLTSSITVNGSNVSKAIEIAIENSSNSTVENKRL